MYDRLTIKSHIVFIIVLSKPVRNSSMNEKNNRVFKAVLELYENDEERAQHWMSSRLKALGGKTPKEVLTTPEGEQKVLQLIIRIEHSVYS